MKLFSLCTAGMLLTALSASAQEIRLSINQDSGIYERGQQAVVSAQTSVIPQDSLTVRVLSNNRLVNSYRILPQQTRFEVSSLAIDTTCAIMVEVQAGEQTSTIGYVVAPQGFQAGYTEPDDLMEYWNDQKKQLQALPMKVQTTPLKVPDSYQGKYVCEDVEINCLGPAPVRAYVAKPVKAKRKSLPIIVLCRAAGVSGNWCRCQVGECVGNAAQGNGALSLDLNAHGMLNGQPDEYYKTMEDVVLSNYFNCPPMDRETYYFKGMYLRLLRAIEYMTRMPEWDGKRILVIGESQGGGQAVAAAGLDPRVSAVVLNVPAIQDLGGARAGRQSGWPRPIENHTDLPSQMVDHVLPYFDGSQLIRHSRAEIFCELGLIDTTCPPSSVWATLNAAKSKKTILCVPFRTHAWPTDPWRTLWDEKYYHPRLEFINTYLK